MLRQQRCELRGKGTTLSLARRVMERGQLLHSPLTCPPGGNAWHLTSRHPFVPGAQLFTSSSEDNNRSAALWADHRWNAEWTPSFNPDVGTHPPANGHSSNSADPDHPPPHRCWTLPLLLTQMGYGTFSILLAWCRAQSVFIPLCFPGFVGVQHKTRELCKKAFPLTRVAV